MPSIKFALCASHLVPARAFHADQNPHNLMFHCPNCHKELEWKAATQPHEIRKKPHKAYFKHHWGEACIYSEYKKKLIEHADYKRIEYFPDADQLLYDVLLYGSFETLGEKWKCKATHTPDKPIS